ncbi:putative lipoprotein [Variovorax paradoxus B4]|uniref:Putative lipoprotein n=1 Tax=Variovorax paradoxus B4 TaxID=1246301 RepID=T1X8C8_VARPD|nr:YjbH domain-containing protein [Variovorax paradoxus]AGU49177.1 putative lipoprotein [Variovorax paradoxus B4]
MRPPPPPGPITNPFRLSLLAAAIVLMIPSAHAAATTRAPAGAAEVRPGERLSDWLLRQPEDAASPGLAWQVPQELLAQQFLKESLLVRVEAAVRSASPEERASREQLLSVLQSLPATGRVALGIVDPRWLQANPGQDPVLSEGQRLAVPPAPLRTVTVVQPDGSFCRVPHEGGRLLLDYLSACGLDSGADWAWIAQPDGRTARAGIGAWNAEPADEPAPGAWIWAPPRRMSALAALSEGLIKFLAVQGPSPQEPSTAPPAADAPVFAAPTVAGTLPEAVASQPRPLDISGNDWGETGLLQTPSARMGVAGDTRASLTSIWPYTRLNVMFQPFDWMEAGFRYTSISNRVYGPTFVDQSFKDKSIDLKVRLLEESTYLPQLALGFRDIGGTGLFSSEYLVAGKRLHEFDFSLGIGWGYLGASGNITNPFKLLGSRFDTRPRANTTGNANISSFFRGPAALFGGVQWRTPWDPLTLKLEYDGNDYQSEPLSSKLRRRSPINIGLSYRVSPKVTLSAGFERGDKFMIGLTLASNLAASQSPKPADRPLPEFRPEAAPRSPGWATTAAEIEAQTEWTVERIAPKDDVLHVWVTDSNTVYRTARVEKAIAVLHHDAPDTIKSFVFHYAERGLAVHAQAVDRAEWVAARIQALPPHAARAVSKRDYEPELARPDEKSGTAQSTVAEAAATETNAPWVRPRDKFTFGIAPSYGQIVGGPDAFLLYQLGIQATAEYRFTPRTWLSGAVNLRLADNYDKFTYTAPSDLPRVRTYQREYVTSRRFTIPSLQLTHVGQLSSNHYYSMYGGLLESMFAGVGAEWMYRPARSPVAFGVDINRVRQRDFNQDFGLRDYKVTTGHASLYWDTGWNGVMAKISAGQYLAGDRGVTLEVIRRFDNGFVLGAYATKTNVSSARFGEGSFDKGIYLSIPLDALLPRSSKFALGFAWSPLTRDGGARLGRSNTLYELTSVRDQGAFNFAAPPDNKPRAGDNILNFDRSSSP